MIDSHKAHNERKIQLIMRINFVSFIDNNDHCIIHTKSDNIEIMSGIETNDIINDLFKSFLKRYQENLETKMKGSSIIFESVDLLYYSHKIRHSPDWIKVKKATINPKNDNNKCFKYGIIAALNHEKIGKNPQRISKIKPFINNYNWKDTEFPSYTKDWKKFEQNNKTIALNILFVPFNTEEIRPAYISKYNNKRCNHENLQMITDIKIGIILQ